MLEQSSLTRYLPQNMFTCEYTGVQLQVKSQNYRWKITGHFSLCYNEHMVYILMKLGTDAEDKQFDTIPTSIHVYLHVQVYNYRWKLSRKYKWKITGFFIFCYYEHMISHIFIKLGMDADDKYSSTWYLPQNKFTCIFRCVIAGEKISEPFLLPWA